MTAIERTAYPRFRHTLSPAELHEYFTPTAADMAFAHSKAYDVVPQCVLLVLLKTTQRLGYVPRLADIPAEVQAHLRWYLHLDEAVPFTVPDRSVRRYGHAIRGVLGLTADAATIRMTATTAMEAAAQVMDQPPDIINAAIEILVKERCELPAFSTLDRLAGTIRTRINDGWYDQVMQRLAPATIQIFERLLTTTDATEKSGFNQLKATPKSATLAHLDRWLEHLDWMTELGEYAPWLVGMPVTKAQHFAAEARSLDAAEMRDYTPARRYTLLACLIQSARVQTQDELVTMLIKRIAAMHTQGKTSLDTLRQHQRATEEAWMDAFAEITRAAGEHPDDMNLGKTTRAVLQRFGNPEEILVAYEVVAKYHGNNYLPLLWKHFQSHRSALFKLLRVLDVRSTSQDQSLMAAISYLLANEGRRARSVEATLDLSFTTEQWRRTISVRRNKRLRFDRRRLEVCIFSAIASEFKSGDLAIPHSAEYADIRDQLVPWEQCTQALATYCDQMQLPAEGATFVQHLRDELTSLAHQVDQRLPYLQGQVTITDGGEIVLRRPAAKPMAKTTKRMMAAVQARMPERTVLAALTNAYHYCEWTRHFGPRSGSDTKVTDAVTRYILVAFGSGCNLGPWQVARHLKQGVSAHELSYTNRRHVTTKLIDKGIVDVINVYAQCALPKVWGTGHVAAADGTKLELARDNLLSEYHIRYGGYGGIAYYHISDTYVALCSHFITCGTWEGIYILDGLLKNQSTVQPHTLHADTQGQTTTVFGMAYLLGIQLMPRIRNWKHVIFYRPDATITYQHIESLFKDTIDWELLETHWQDLMHVILSIRAGRVLPSTILRKLKNDSQKNRIHQVFRELGRVIRTLFLLRYISEKPLREQITAATNKVESYNAFSQWLAFGNNGKIMDNEPIEMEKVVKFNQLVANCVMLQNVLDMSAVIRGLMEEGYPVTLEAVQGLSPYLHEHLQRYGLYDVDVTNVPPPISAMMLAPLFAETISADPVPVA